MDIEKTWLLEMESLYWTNVNTDIEHMVKQCATCLEYQQMQPQERVLPSEIPCRQLEVVGADIFMVNNKILLCVVNYNSKFPIVKKVGSVLGDVMVQMVIMVFAKYQLPSKKLF